MSNFQNLLASMNKLSEPTTPSTKTEEKTNEQSLNRDGEQKTSILGGALDKSATTPEQSTVESATPREGNQTAEEQANQTEQSSSASEEINQFLSSMQQLEEQIPNGEFLADMMRNVISRIQEVPHIQEFVYKNTKHLETIVSAMHSASSVKQARTYGRRKKAAKKEKNIEMTLDVLKDLEF